MIHDPEKEFMPFNAGPELRNARPSLHREVEGEQLVELGMVRPG